MKIGGENVIKIIEKIEKIQLFGKFIRTNNSSRLFALGYFYGVNALSLIEDRQKRNFNYNGEREIKINSRDRDPIILRLSKPMNLPPNKKKLKV